MAFHSYAELDTDPDDAYAGAVSLGTEPRGQHTLMVFDGPMELEMVFRFTELTVGRNSVAFYSAARGKFGRRTKVGSIEADERLVEFLIEAVEQSEALDYDVVVDR